MNKTTDLKELNNTNFKEAIKKGITLVDFWAPWCMPCRMQAPILEDTAITIGSKAQICKLNVDDNQETAMEYGIISIPTLLLFKDGELVKQFVGVQNKAILVDAINSVA